MTAGAPIFYPASPIQIRDGIAARFEAVDGLTVFKSRRIATKDAHLPFASIWYPHDRMEPNGDANVGTPEFLHTITFRVEILDKCPADVEPTVAEDFVTFVESLRASLLTDPTWVDLLEGIERCEIDYGLMIHESNFTLAKAEMEIEVTIRSEWPPVVPNAFTTVAVRTTDGAEGDIGEFNAFATEFHVPSEDDPA